MSEHPEANTQYPVPTTPGFYLCSVYSSAEFDTIARVSGQAPFLQIHGWSIPDDRISPIYYSKVKRWGPKIYLTSK